MANEIRATFTLQITKGELKENISISFLDDMVAEPAAGSPGRIVVSAQGTDVDLSKITNPGWGYFKNLDDTNYVELGVWNPDQSEFYPFALIKPETGFIMPLNPNINEEYAGTGTGTTGQLNTLRLLAQNASCECDVRIFEY